MKKCYRSSKQITEYAKNLCNIKEMQTVSREGKEVENFISIVDEESFAYIENKFNEWKKYNKIANEKIDKKAAAKETNEEDADAIEL